MSGEIADFVFVWPSGSRQNESWKERRRGTWQEVRPYLVRRFARRGGDKRSPSYLYRCPTRPDYRQYQEMRHFEPGVRAR